MASEQSLDQVIESLYAAALDPTGWQPALQRINRCFDAAASCVFVMENATRRVPYWVGLGLDAGAKDYRKHYAAIDPRAQFAAANPQTLIHYDRMLIDERGMDRSEFYDWQNRSADGLRYFIGCRIAVDPDHSGFAALHWHRRHGHADASDIHLFKRLAPHFRRALQLSNRLGAAERCASTMAELFDRLAQAAMLVDRSGQVVSLNSAANSIVSADDGLAVTARRLVLRNGSDDSALQKLIGDAAATPPGAGGFAVASRSSGRAPYVLLVAPLPKQSAPFAADAAAVAVFITDPEQRRELPEDVLIRLYRLTRAEAAMAVRIVAGTSLKQAAGDLEIAATTARLHLQRVMNKTGTHRQSDLVRLLLTAVPSANAR